MKIIIPKKRSFIALFVLPIWFYAWVKAFSGMDATTLMIVLAIFLLPILLSIYVFLFNLIGKEIISLGENYFVIIKKLMFLSFKKQYEINYVKDFNYLEEEKYWSGYYKSFSAATYIGDGNINCNYKDDNIKFGIGLYDFEARPIIEQLNKELSQLKNVNVNKTNFV